MFLSAGVVLSAKRISGTCPAVLEDLVPMKPTVLARRSEVSRLALGGDGADADELLLRVRPVDTGGAVRTGIRRTLV